MTKFLRQITALLVVPCLIVDTAFAVGLNPTQSSSKVAVSPNGSLKPYFIETQALTSMAMLVQKYLGDRKQNARVIDVISPDTLTPQGSGSGQAMGNFIVMGHASRNIFHSLQPQMSPPDGHDGAQSVPGAASAGKRPIVVVADKIDTKALGVPVEDISKSADKIADLIRISPDILIVRSATKVTAEIMQQLPNLKIIIRGGHGTDNIDTKYAAEHGIRVVKTGGSEKPVAGLVMRMTARADQRDNQFSHDQAPASFFALSEWQAAIKSKIKPEMSGAEKGELMLKADALLRPIGGHTMLFLRGKTVGILGFGGIAQQVADNAKKIGMKVIVYAPSLAQNPGKATQLGYRVGTPAEIYRESHFVVPMMGLNKEGTHKNVRMINSEVLNLIGENPNFIALVNADRGELVDESAMLHFLNRNPHAQYIVDEVPRDAALKAKVLYTPHIGASTPSGEKDVVKATADVLAPIYKELSTATPVPKTGSADPVLEQAAAMILADPAVEAFAPQIHRTSEGDAHTISITLGHPTEYNQALILGVEQFPLKDGQINFMVRISGLGILALGDRDKKEFLELVTRVIGIAKEYYFPQLGRVILSDSYDNSVISAVVTAGSDHLAGLSQGRIKLSALDMKIAALYFRGILDFNDTSRSISSINPRDLLKIIVAGRSVMDNVLSPEIAMPAFLNDLLSLDSGMKDLSRPAEIDLENVVLSRSGLSESAALKLFAHARNEYRSQSSLPGTGSVDVSHAEPDIPKASDAAVTPRKVYGVLHEIKNVVLGVEGLLHPLLAEGALPIVRREALQRFCDTVVRHREHLGEIRYEYGNLPLLLKDLAEAESFLDELNAGATELASQFKEDANSLSRIQSVMSLVAKAAWVVADFHDGHQTRAIHLNEFLQANIEGYQSAYIPGSMELIVRYADDLPTILASDVQMDEILRNLILNAVEANQKNVGKARITIETKWFQSMDAAVLSVSDTGVGVPEAHIAHIFEPHYSTHGEPQVARGIGLANVAEVVREMGATIDVTSEEAEGATFTVRFPAAAQAPADKPAAAPVPGTGSANQLPSVIRVLDLSQKGIKQELIVDGQVETLTVLPLDDLNTEEIGLLSDLLDVYTADQASEPGKFFVFGDTRGAWILAHTKIEPRGSRLFRDITLDMSLRTTMDPLRPAPYRNQFDLKVRYFPLTGWTLPEGYTPDPEDEIKLSKTQEQILQWYESFEALSDIVKHHFDGQLPVVLDYVMDPQFVNAQLHQRGEDRWELVARRPRLSDGTILSGDRWKLDDDDPNLIHLKTDPSTVARRNADLDYDLVINQSKNLSPWIAAGMVLGKILPLSAVASWLVMPVDALIALIFVGGTAAGYGMRQRLFAQAA